MNNILTKYFYQIGVLDAPPGETILTSPIFIRYFLPFVLIFTVVFAILQKSGILGKEKRQIDALVSLVVALIVISFGNAVGIITVLLPFLAVSMIVILVFLLLYSFAFQGDDGFKLHPGIKIGLFVVVLIGVIIATTIATGAWDYIRYEWLLSSDSTAITTNIIFLIAVIAVIVIALVPSTKKDKA